MDLKDFVKSSLLDVMGAIAQAQKEWMDGGGNGAINPVMDRVDKEAIREISFDVAVTAGGGTSARAGGGIQVVGLRLGGDLADTTSHSSVSRIQFSIPIIPAAITVQSPGLKGPIPYNSPKVA